MSVVTKEADNLIGGAVKTDNRFPAKAGEIISRGDLLSYDGNTMAKATVAADAVSVAVKDVDATAGSKPMAYYVAGSDLYEKGILFGALDVNDVYKALLANGIVVKG